MPKDNLRDKLDGNELDLSLNNLSVVPVKELATIPKATRLDLSCNLLTTLPDSFCLSLRYLVKIDLSKNSLTELPHNFGLLQSLQHLDLLGNQLTILPLGFWQCRKLRWLDLKDNPLTDELKKVAGDCLDEAQCKKCAEMVLEHLKSINSRIEREKQLKLKEERDKEELLKIKEENERKRKQEDRKRRKEEQKRERERLKITSMKQEEHFDDEVVEPNGKFEQQDKFQVKKAPGRSCCSLYCVLGFLTVLLAMSVGICYMSEEIKASSVWKDHVEPKWEIYGSPYWQKYGVPYWQLYGEPAWVYSKSSANVAWVTVQQKFQDLSAFVWTEETKTSESSSDKVPVKEKSSKENTAKTEKQDL